MKTKLFLFPAAVLALSLIVPATATAIPFTAKILGSGDVTNGASNSTTITATGANGSVVTGGALFALKFEAWTSPPPPIGTGIPGIDGDQKFLAMCLEPSQTVSYNTVYHWNLVDLAEAPTTHLNGTGGPAPMTAANALRLKRAIAYLGESSLSAIESDENKRDALQAAAWSVSNTSGATITVPTLAQSLWGDLLLAMDDTSINVSGVKAFGLNNLGTNGYGSGQDLFVFTYTKGTQIASTPEPTTIVLFGLGLAGVGVYRKRRTAR